MALLYQAHPRPLDLEPKEIIPGAGTTWTAEQEQAANGTFQWLARNGFVDGDYQLGSFLGAQLTASGFRFLTNREPNIGRSLGDYAVSFLSQPNEREERSVGELLVRRLTGG